MEQRKAKAQAGVFCEQEKKVIEGKTIVSKKLGAGQVVPFIGDISGLALTPPQKSYFGQPLTVFVGR